MSREGYDFNFHRLQAGLTKEEITPQWGNRAKKMAQENAQKIMLPVFLRDRNGFKSRVTTIHPSSDHHDCYHQGT